MSGTKKIAAITGGNSGIGQGIARQLAAEGWNIAICDISDSSNPEFQQELVDLGAEVVFCAANVSVSHDVNSYFQVLEDVFGSAPSLLVNNAGIQTWSPLLDLKEEDWDRVIATNLKGCFLNTQAAAKLMIKYNVSGSIINIGSGCNQYAFPKLVDYTASKGGVEMFTKVAAVELGEHKIRVNCVAPGGILIERTQAESPDYANVWAEASVLNRVGYPEDIANAISFLASEKSDYITGQTIFVDGGVNSKANWPY